MTCATRRLGNAVTGPHRASKKIKAAIRKRPAAGAGMLKVAKVLGVGVSTVQGVKARDAGNA